MKPAQYIMNDINRVSSCLRKNSYFGLLYYHKCAQAKNMKYKEGNNRPSSINQISLVHNHDKAGNKCYTQDNTDTRETQV